MTDKDLNKLTETLYSAVNDLGIFRVLSLLSMIPRDKMRDYTGAQRRYWMRVASKMDRATKTVSSIKNPMELRKISDITQTPILGIERAEHLLAQSLKNGPKKSNDIKAEAKAINLSIATLRRAKERLGILSYRVGGSGGAWYWQSPERLP
jgi:hypothetical protein